MITFVYKVIRNLKHKEHGWLTSGRFVECRPEFAKNYVIRRELARCPSGDNSSVDALWIDDVPDPKRVVKKEAEQEKPAPKPKKAKK